VTKQQPGLQIPGIPKPGALFIAAIAVVRDVLNYNRLPNFQIVGSFNFNAYADRYLLGGVPKDAYPVMWVRAQLISLDIV
jgi:hypothetical protein